MAEFNPKQQEFQAPQYTGASRGLDYKADVSKGMLFEGFGKAFEGLVKGLDEGVQENIRQDTQKGFDNINKEFGVDAATAIYGQSIPGPNSIANQTQEVQPVPETIVRATNQLKGLAAAAEQRPELSVHFGSRMHNMVRQLRSKYPGYNTQIDEIVSQVTGMRPANYLRNELFQEIQKGVGQAQKDRDATIKYAKEHGYLGGVQWQGGVPINPDTRQPLTLEEINVRIADGQARKAGVERENAELELEAKRNTADVRRTTEIFTARVNSHVNQRLNDALGETGQSWKRIVDSISKLQTNVAANRMPDPAEINQVMGQLSQLTTQLSLELESIAASPFSPNSPNSFATVLGKPEDRKKIQEQALAPLQLVRDALEKGDLGLLKVAATHLEVQKNARTAQMTKDYPVLSLMPSLRSIYGDQAMSNFMINQEPVRDATIDIIRSFNRLSALTDDPQNPQRSLVDDLKGAKQRGLASPELTKAHIDSWLKEVRNPKAVDDKMLAQLTMYMFGPKNLSLKDNMTAPDAQSFLTQIASPEVSKRMQQLRTTYPQAYDAYQAWTMVTAQAAVKSAADELSKYNLDRRETMFAWNPKTNQFQAVFNPSAKDKYLRPDGSFDLAARAGQLLKDNIPLPFSPSAAAQFAYAKSAVDKLNQTIAVVAPIIIDNKQDVGVQMNMLLRSLGVRSQSGATVNDFLLEALTKAQAAAEVGPDAQPFRQPTNIWKLLAPFNPVWENPEVGSIGVQHDRTINEVLPSNAVPNAASPQQTPLLDQTVNQQRSEVPVSVPDLRQNTPDEEIPPTPQTPRQELPPLSSDQFPGYVPKDKRPVDRNDPYYTKPVGKYRKYVPESGQLTQADLDEAADAWNVPVTESDIPKTDKQTLIPAVPDVVKQLVLPTGKTLEQATQEALQQGKQLTTTLAEQFMDLHERNPSHAKTLVSFFKQMGVGLNNPASVPWCAAFVDSIVKASGESGTGSLLARSFLKWGTPVDKPQRGDVVVIQRGSRNGPLGHVGFFDGYDKEGNILILGGNQSNKVSVDSFPPETVLGFRRPKSLNSMTNADKQFFSTVAQQGATASKNYRPSVVSTQ